MIDNTSPIIKLCSYYGEVENCTYVGESDGMLCGIFYCPRLHRSVKEVLRSDKEKQT